MEVELEVAVAVAVETAVCVAQTCEPAGTCGPRDDGSDDDAVKPEEKVLSMAASGKDGFNSSPALSHVDLISDTFV